MQDLVTFRVQRNLTFFLQGLGKLQVHGLNRIELSELRRGTQSCSAITTCPDSEPLPRARSNQSEFQATCNPSFVSSRPPKGRVSLYVE